MVRERGFVRALVRIGRGLGLGLLGIMLLGLSGWGVMALLNFGHLAEGLKKGLAGLFGLASAVTLVGFLMPRWRLRALALHGGLFLLVLGCWLTLLQPSNDRDWQPDVAVLPYATFQGDLVTVHNIRNFQYRSETDYTPGYYDKTFDLRQLDSVDLYAVHWMGPHVAHVMLSFGFGGKDHLAISIEMRKEKGEEGSTLRSLFRQYELCYVVADERDVVRLRTNYRKNPPEDTYLYRLKGEAQGSGRRIFMDYLKRINSLKERPEWYNTLTSNCTNTIWVHSRANPGHIPYSWKVLVSGHLPELLFEAGKFEGQGPFPELQRRSLINSAAQEADQAEDFSQRIRQGR